MPFYFNTKKLKETVEKRNQFVIKFITFSNCNQEKHWKILIFSTPEFQVGLFFKTISTEILWSSGTVPLCFVNLPYLFYSVYSKIFVTMSPSYCRFTINTFLHCPFKNILILEVLFPCVCHPPKRRFGNYLTIENFVESSSWHSESLKLSETVAKKYLFHRNF